MRLTGLRFRYQGAEADALGPLDVAGPEDRPWLLLGPSGSGKTTLLRVLAGQLRAPAGGPEPSVPGIAYLPQFPERALAGRNLAEDLCGQVRPDRETRARLRRALAEVGMEGRPLSLRNRGLSGGERRQVSLALLRLAGHAHWALDEPDAGLDAAGRRRLLNVLADRGGQGGRTWIASHRLDLYGPLHPWVLVLDRGRAVASGDLEQVLGRPEVTRLLGLEAWAPVAVWGRTCGESAGGLFAPEALSGFPGVLRSALRDRMKSG